MSNVAGKAYGMTVITPMSARMSWINRWIFRATRAFPGTLSGLIGLKFIHFARWVIVKRDQWPAMGDKKKQHLSHDCMLFTSNFNGTWDQYIDAFSDGIPVGLDLFWYKNFKYPGSIPITPFKNYIRNNQIDTDYYYNATPGIAYRGLTAALRVRKAVLKLEREHAERTPEEFAEGYRRCIAKVQNDLTTQGFAPVASIDTDLADINRSTFRAVQEGRRAMRAQTAAVESAMGEAVDAIRSQRTPTRG